MDIRIAAIGDLHLRTEIPEQLMKDLRGLADRADVLVVAGDITDGGRIPEVELAAELFGELSLPILAVMGNHDRRTLRRREFCRILDRAGVTLLDGDAVALNRRIGFAGVGGYGGGFWPDEGPAPLHTRVSQALAVRARREALRLDTALQELHTDTKIVVMHYSPTTSTLGNEPILKYWMLGNCELARVIDRYQVDLVIHGHAHLGNHAGQTVGGTPVRNVASPVTGGPVIYRIALRDRPRALVQPLHIGRIA